MQQHELMMVAMAEKCGQLLQKSKNTNVTLAAVLQPAHLQWMCGQLQKHAEHWPQAKQHRWLGYIQAGLVAHGMIDFPQLKSMFAEAKIAYSHACGDWLDHLDHETVYRVDIGGQG